MSSIESDIKMSENEKLHIQKYRKVFKQPSSTLRRSIPMTKKVSFAIEDGLWFLFMKKIMFV